MSRGGRRPGAGAPGGNTNALKSGRYSQRVRHLEQLLEDVAAYAVFAGSVPGPRRQELQRHYLALHTAALTLLACLRGRRPVEEPALERSEGLGQNRSMLVEARPLIPAPPDPASGAAP